MNYWNVLAHSNTTYFHLLGPECEIEIKKKNKGYDKLSLKWSEPSCDGWTEGIKYSIELNCLSPNCSTIRNAKEDHPSVEFSNLTTGVHNVTVTSRNLCGETTSSSLYTCILGIEDQQNPIPLLIILAVIIAILLVVNVVLIGCCCKKWCLERLIKCLLVMDAFYFLFSSAGARI